MVFSEEKHLIAGQTVGRKMKYVLLIGLMTMIIQTAAAEKAYICVPVKSVGFVFSQATHDWDYNQFSVTGKKYLLTHDQTGWEWYESGSRSPLPEYCQPNDAGFIDCDGFEDIRVNIKSLRFQTVFPLGYIGNPSPRHPEGVVSPKIEIGTCSVTENSSGEKGQSKPEL
jgi:hypothetical protein